MLKLLLLLLQSRPDRLLHHRTWRRLLLLLHHLLTEILHNDHEILLELRLRNRTLRRQWHVVLSLLAGNISTARCSNNGHTLRRLLADDRIGERC